MSGSSDSPRYPLKRCPIIDDGTFINFLIWDSNAGKLACYTYTETFLQTKVYYCNLKFPGTRFLVLKIRISPYSTIFR